jgi:hypothetical protein
MLNGISLLRIIIFLSFYLIFNASAHAIFISGNSGQEVTFSKNSSELVLEIAQGKLKGAFNISTGAVGVFFDVTLVDGRYMDIYESDEDLLPLSTSVWLSRALVSEVLKDFDSLQLNSNPSLTYGCKSISICNIWTPYSPSLGPSNARVHGVANYKLNQYDRSNSRFLNKYADLSEDEESVFALWTLSSKRRTHSVDEPNTYLAFYLVFVGLILFKMRNRLS